MPFYKDYQEDDDEFFEFWTTKDKAFIWQKQSFLGVLEDKAHIFREDGGMLSLCEKVDCYENINVLVKCEPTDKKEVCKVCFNKYIKMDNDVMHWRDVEGDEQNRRDMEEYQAFIIDERNYDMAAITPHIPNQIWSRSEGRWVSKSEVLNTDRGLKALKEWQNDMEKDMHPYHPEFNSVYGENYYGRLLNN